jgi:uncharacterized protein (TIGR03578 family)
MNEELLKEKTLSLTISSEGKTMEELYNSILLKLRKEVYAKAGGYLIQMVPLSFVVKDYHTEEKIEKFLLLFLPKKRIKYFLTAEITVKVKILNSIR